MNQIGLPAVFLLLMASLLASPGCSLMGFDDTLPPEVRVTSLAAIPGGALERRFAVSLVLHNPDVEVLEATRLAFDVDLAGTRVSYDVAREFSIAPGEEITIDLTATSLSLDVYRRILALRGAGSVRYSLSGRVSRGAMTRALRFRGSGSFEAAPAP